MDPSKITLESMSKLFEYEKLSRDIDSIEDTKTLKEYAKAYIKLYLSQQEVISNLGL